MEATQPMFDSQEWQAKKAHLQAVLARHESLLVAFSGGVDSSVLLHAALQALGERAIGLIADSASLPRQELADALALAQGMGARLEVVRTAEGEDERYQANRGDRCYWCKSHLFNAMLERAGELGVSTLAFGEITDDLHDDRPGARAARERNVIAPLREAGFSKEEVRRYAREAGLPVAEKPASACLASRLPLGKRVTPEGLARIERAEAGLKQLGLRQLRVRDHGQHARVEVGWAELSQARSLSEIISKHLADCGFQSHELAAYQAPSERRK